MNQVFLAGLYPGISFRLSAMAFLPGLRILRQSGALFYRPDLLAGTTLPSAWTSAECQPDGGRYFLTRGISAIEEAYMISRLISEEKFTLSEVGKLWGRSKSWVSRRLALLVHLEPKLKKDLGTGHLSPRVAQELLRLPRGNEQARVLVVIRKSHLNKDEAAQLVSHWLHASEEEKKSL